MVNEYEYIPRMNGNILKLKPFKLNSSHLPLHNAIIILQLLNKFGPIYLDDTNVVKNF